jgi:hypothetical protein
MPASANSMSSFAIALLHPRGQAKAQGNALQRGE